MQKTGSAVERRRTAREDEDAGERAGTTTSETGA
jgi:hypothetical protein